MEPPSKRPRFSFAQDLNPDLDADLDADLGLPATAEDNDNYDVEEPDNNPINLEEARARNDQRLKSIFESIFAKYEKDFTEVGDEIDLQSGRIIVNNGHLQRMEGEDDTGEKDAGWLAQLSTPVDHEEEEEESASDAGSARDGYEEVDHHYEETQWSESTELPVDGDGPGAGAVWEGNPNHESQPAAGDADDNTGAYSGDDDDDTSSVDSLLDSALSVNRADRMRQPARVTSTIPSTKKAIPAIETAGGLYPVRDAVACSKITTTATAPTTTKRELVDPKWRVPNINSKFTQPAAFPTRILPKPSSANNKKNPSNPFDKTTFAHSVSPPGARSLWAVPLPGRPRKTNADASRPKKRERQERHVTEAGLGLHGDKQKEAKEEKERERAKERERTKEREETAATTIHAGKIVPDAAPTSASKLKPYSSPMIASNWSFSSILDGSDSDDPLQEYQPSPTPTASAVRGRRMGSEGTMTPSRPQSLPQSFSQSPSQSRCNGCRRLFPGNEEHVLHLRSVLASGLPDGQHDGGMVRRILEKIDDAHARDSDSHESTSSLETYESPSPPPPSPPRQPPPPPPEDTPQDTTALPKHRARARAATPDEVKLIITMRHVQRKPWKEILDHFPGKRSSNLIQWNQLHWTERRARPPPSSGPWSVVERGRLSAIKDEQGLSWAAIRKKLPGRTTVEIEFELLRLWVGNRIWNGEGQLDRGNGGEIETAPGVYHHRNQQTDGSGDLDPSGGNVTLAEPSVRRTIGDKTEIPDSRETSIGLPDGQTPPQSKSNADSFGILYEDQQPFDSIEYDDEPGVDS